MPYAVELFLDAECEAAIRRIWKAISDAGVESVMLDIASRPHLTLGIFEQVDPAGLEAGLERFGREVAPFRVSFSSVGIFPSSKNTIFLAAGVTLRLLEVHTSFHGRFGGLGTGPWELYLPGRWVPHATLATDVPAGLIAEALAAARSAPLPLEGTVQEIALVRFAPVEYIFTSPLSGE